MGTRRGGFSQPPFPVPVWFVKATGAFAHWCFSRYRTVAVVALGVRPAPQTAVVLCWRPGLRASADLSGGTASLPAGMGGEARSTAAVGFEGRVKSLGLVFEDERKGCYSSGETVAGHVLLEAAEPVALRALRLEAQGRATAAWGPSAGARVSAGGAVPAASEVEYLNVRLSLREPPAGERPHSPVPTAGPRRPRGRGWEGERREGPRRQDARLAGGSGVGGGSPSPSPGGG
jgi:hypothetical protein